MIVMEHKGIPKPLVLHLAAKYGLRSFVETGTYLGETALWAADHFESVITIEFSRPIFESTSSRCGHASNVSFIFGDSRIELNTVVSRLTGPALFWLDGHWSGDATYGQNDECPLITEIDIINRSPFSHFLFIDDARLFFSPPPPPHKPQAWPSISEVLHTLQAGGHGNYIIIIDDVIIAVPIEAKEELIRYCQELNSRKPLPAVEPATANRNTSGEPWHRFWALVKRRGK